jgi:hypothetical protein
MSSSFNDVMETQITITRKFMIFVEDLQVTEDIKEEDIYTTVGSIGEAYKKQYSILN